ncbi:MAG: heme o synthase [Candidatus Limnocylindrales bacterium]
MTRFQKLAATTVAGTLLLVTVGVIVRATDSGLGCPDWPFCYGKLLPALDDPKAWIEWLHRTIAAVLGLIIVAQAVVAFIDHRDRRSLLWPSIAAVLLVGFQAYLGRQTVLLGNTSESVTAHLATSQALLGLLVYILVRSFFPARIGGRGGSQRFTLLAAFGAAATYALLLFGARVTASDAALIFPDWPLMGGTLLPPLTEVTATHVLHRWVAIVVGLILAAIVVAALRTQRRQRAVVRLALAAGVVFVVQAIVGGLQVVTQLAAWTQTLHVALGALVWSLMCALAVTAYYTARVSAPIGSGLASGRRVPGGEAGTDGVVGSSSAQPNATGTTGGQSIRAYIALTKPRIIELLLVTTIPAMVLAARDVPGLGFGEWTWLAVWTLIGGSLAAGSANAINCYLDRDIDELMVRTRRRPLPAHQVEPERAVVFGLILGAISLVVMAWFVNLVAAFLTLLAIAFYVVVYTIMLKRTTTQNIVIGGAAGALPPVIGWAAVTGSVALPAVILFAIVFYWTPPHFWALSLRIRKDYAAARVPMLPVVHGVPETTRQIALYTILLVAISLVLFAVARMGLVYLGSALVLGAIFIWQAYRLWRVGTSEEGSTAGAIRLYRYSITYLTLLFAAVAVDALVAIPHG